MSCDSFFQAVPSPLLNDTSSLCSSDGNDSFVTAFSLSSISLDRLMDASVISDNHNTSEDVKKTLPKVIKTSRYLDNLKPSMRGLRTSTGDIPKGYIMTRVERGNRFLGEDHNKVYHQVKVMSFPGPIAPTGETARRARYLEVVLDRQALYDIQNAPEGAPDQLVFLARQKMFMNIREMISMPEYQGFIQVCFSDRRAMASAARRGWSTKTSYTDNALIAARVDHAVGPLRNRAEFKLA